MLIYRDLKLELMAYNYKRKKNTSGPFVKQHLIVTLLLDFIRNFVFLLNILKKLCFFTKYRLYMIKIIKYKLFKTLFLKKLCFFTKYLLNIIKIIINSLNDILKKLCFLLNTLNIIKIIENSLKCYFWRNCVFLLNIP